MRVRSVLRGVLVVLVLGAAGLGGFVWWNLHDRSPGSEFSVVVRPTPSVPANEPEAIRCARQCLPPSLVRCT